MFAELVASEGRHALSMNGCYVTFDRLLNTLKLTSCKPRPPLDSTHCFSLYDGFFFFFFLTRTETAKHLESGALKLPFGVSVTYVK